MASLGVRAAWPSVTGRQLGFLRYLPAMTFSGEDLQLIKDRGPGWEAVWQRLWGRLYVRLHEWVKPGPLNDPDRCKLNRDHFRVLRNLHEADDFIAEFLEDLRRRAHEGTLLAGFDLDADTDVCSYLIRIAPQRAVTHMRRRRHRASDAGLDEATRPERGPLAMEDPGECLSEIEHPVGAPLGAVVRQAAMQVHPKLERTVANVPTLEADLQSSLQPGGHASGLDHLGARHAEHGGQLRREIAELQEALEHATRAGSEHRPKSQHRIETRLDRREADLIVAPLDKTSVMALLGISDDAARGQISRYRRRENLLQIFPRLRRSVEEANDGRFDAILGGSEGDSA